MYCYPLFFIVIIASFLIGLNCFKESYRIYPPFITKYRSNHLYSSTESFLDKLSKSFNNFVDEKFKISSSLSKPIEKMDADNVKALKEVDFKISENKALLVNASLKLVDDTDQVVESLLNLEKLMRERNKLDGGMTSQETLLALNGSWRLIFTTGTVDTQKKIGRRVNYFPLKAIQSFDPQTKIISNGIFIGDFALIKFFGTFEWKEKARKLEFDFDVIELFGFKINLPKGGAAQIGQSTGLGSEANVELAKKDMKPFFNWISADEYIATARGGGGGLALWRRNELVE